jgi:hypothetical protein
MSLDRTAHEVDIPKKFRGKGIWLSEPLSNYLNMTSAKMPGHKSMPDCRSASMFALCPFDGRVTG